MAKGDRMTLDELRQAAIDYLGKAFKKDSSANRVQPEVIHAAVSVLAMARADKPAAGDETPAR